MHRRVVVAAFGAAALAPVAWLVGRPESALTTRPATADERRAAELLASVRLLILLTEPFPEDPVMVLAHGLHQQQADALERVVGPMAVATPTPPAGAPWTVFVSRAERDLARLSLLSAVETADPDYARLFSALHASASQLLAELRKDGT